MGIVQSSNFIEFSKGADIMKKSKDDLGNLVAKWKQGNVEVEIYDGAYAGKTKEELDQVLERVSETVSRIVYAASVKKIDTSTKERR